MLGIFLDAVILFGLVSFFLRETAPDLKFMFLVSLGLTVVNFLIAIFLAPFIGILVVVPMAVVVGFTLMYFCTLPLSQAAISTGVFIAYKVVLILLVSRM